MRLFFMVTHRGCGEQALRQWQNIAASLAQRQYLECNDVQPIEKILAKTMSGHFSRKIAIRSGDDAGIDLNGAVSSDPFKALFLDEAKKLGLAVRA